ncbi:hypothetical protein LTR37_001722 [Vermiconidia calcicola]|uniref:Uncharacterized protein n=1 Tax=Vermiconidia calcicola TaxID=1690605 RepID=A0ACC3NV20_9PEZI|nr:hypothetical protein LTR37_001722 [Vermiconidia calcicola]
MGNAQSGGSMVYRKLAKELPPVKKMVMNDDYYTYTDVGMKVFVDDKDREQFIYGVIAVATSNGLIDLSDHDFRLLYSRRDDKENERIVARIVAVKDGVIKAKVEPEMDGADQTEAFRALRKDVEIRLDQILQNVPDRNESAAGSSTAGAMRGAASTPMGAPPAYSSQSVGVVSSKKS